MARLAQLPLSVALLGVAAVAMLLPALQAEVLGDRALALIFLRSAAGTGLAATLLGLAVPRARPGRGGLVSLAAAFVLLPVVLGLPLAQALPDTGLLNAWWEMLSAFTTTGASLYDPARLAMPLHLWRCIAGWGGGLLTLAAAVAILAPLQVGGFELVAPPLAPPPDTAGAPMSETRRVGRAAIAILPLYAGATVVLWLGLRIAGDGAFDALLRAMGTVSTSGVIATPGPVGARSGWIGEAMVLAVLLLSLSRRFWPGGEALRTTRRLADDPELRLAAAVILAVGAAVFLRHAAGAESAVRAQTALQTLANGAAAIWGAVFTATSFLTTTGWTSSAWTGAIAWSGLTAPGLILAGLAILGGGAATAAGGVKLLRVAALASHSAREMERIVHPALVTGGGPTRRRLRREGAFLAFVFFMLFAGAITVTVLLLTLQRVEFEAATILAVAALSNTGGLMSAIPLAPTLGGGAGAAGALWEGWAGLPALTKAVLAGAMVVGRLEIVAVIALFSPGYWRR